jgi:dTDP-4-amino-4,6-dideoxygalactose transaminase
VAATYRELLPDSEVVAPIEAEGVRHVYHLFVVRVKNRDFVQAGLQKRGVAAGIHYPIPLPNLQAYRYLNHAPEDFPVANQYSKEILSLPMYAELTRNQVEFVCDQLTEVTKSMENEKC